MADLFFVIASGRVQGVVAGERRQGHGDLRHGGDGGSDAAFQIDRVRHSTGIEDLAQRRSKFRLAGVLLPHIRNVPFLRNRNVPSVA